MTSAAPMRDLVNHRTRFLAKTAPDPETGCWSWTAYLMPNGYGQFGIGRKVFCAHRVAYEMFVGPIPAGLQIDHLCRNRRCVNPAHMEPVTQRENIMRGEGISAKCAVKTHCLRGHEFDSLNTYRRPNGSRECLTCRDLRKHGRS
jgi:hypothetical protein